MHEFHHLAKDISIRNLKVPPWPNHRVSLGPTGVECCRSTALIIVQIECSTWQNSFITMRCASFKHLITRPLSHSTAPSASVPDLARVTSSQPFP